MCIRDRVWGVDGDADAFMRGIALMNDIYARTAEAEVAVVPLSLIHIFPSTKTPTGSCVS